MSGSDIPKGYRETGVATPKKLAQAEATLEWLESNAFRFDGDATELIKAATAEVSRLRDELDEQGSSQAARVIDKIKGSTKNIV